MSRCYTENEIEYPSVTTILSELGHGDALTQWAANCAVDFIGEKFRKIISDDTVSVSQVCVAAAYCFEDARKEWRNVGKEARDIGSAVHHAIESHTQDKTTGKKVLVEPLIDEVKNAYKAFKQWENENIAEWIESERTVICAEHGYAGTLDAVARLKTGGVYVIDFKSSKAFYDEYSLQISAYRYAYGSPVDGMGILRLDKETGLPEWKDYSKVYDRKIEAFHHLVKYWYCAKNRKLMNNLLAKAVRDEN